MVTEKYLKEHFVGTDLEQRMFLSWVFFEGYEKAWNKHYAVQQPVNGV